MGLFFWVLFYIATGVWLGGVSYDTWVTGDSKSLKARLLFPYNSGKGTVGEIKGVDRMPFSLEGFGIAKDEPCNSGYPWYRLFMVILWPVKILVNGVTFPLSFNSGFDSPEKRIERMKTRQKRKLPAPSGDAGQLSQAHEEMAGQLSPAGEQSGELTEVK